MTIPKMTKNDALNIITKIAAPCGYNNIEIDVCDHGTPLMTIYCTAINQQNVRVVIGNTDVKGATQWHYLVSNTAAYLAS